MNQQAKPHVLIVDDSQTNIDILESLLGDGYRFSFALDGKKALNLIKTDPPDLVLLDIVMPRVSGYDVLASLRKEQTTRKIPVILVSTKDEIDDKLDGYERGATAYIAKPLDADEVRSTVSRVLGGT